MDRAPEQARRLLRLLVERGFLDEDQAARFDPGPGGDAGADEGERTGVLAQLVQRGLVDAETIEALGDALDAGEASLGDAASLLPSGSPTSASSTSSGGGTSLPSEEDGDSPALLTTEPVAPGLDGPGTERIPSELLRLERYQVLRLLGRGGAGEVYLARDLRLDRPVAIKLLPHLSARALREARLQARVAHDGVCKVYEAGHAGGRPFVAMQYVAGETLESEARRMTREEIVTAVRDAALAVHAAHTIGLVHRDLKPGNIMIERGQDGASKTFVLDFGLAKEVSSDGSTVEGSVLGTPAYMAPEQAAGDPRRIDRRTDVYGLGATLYHALSGAPPFEGRSVAVLHAVLTADPRPLRARDPAISPDLEAVAHTCLEKDPARRYPSARALAADLDRYLRGEPVTARRVSAARRIARLARRHLAATLVAIAAVLALSGLGAAWIRDRVAARDRAAAVRRFTEEADAIEAAVRLSHLAPLHDTRPERLAIGARLAGIERELAEQPDFPGLSHEALGRGYLALYELDAARAHLDQAWQLGERRAALAFALARTYGALYARALTAARRVADPALRAEAVRAAEQELRAPALDFLRASHDPPGASPELLRGYLAFFEGRHDEALAHARDAARERPWLHEARSLEGDVHGELGQAAEARGDHDEALRELARAATAYGEAAEIGRSDAEVHEAECRVRSWAVEIEAHKRSRPTGESAVALALAACDRSIEANPDAPDAWEHRIHILTVLAEVLAGSGHDRAPALRDAISAAEDLVLLHPDHAPAFAALGQALHEQGRIPASPGEDGGEVLRRSIEAFEHAVALDPWLVTAHHGLGVAYRELAEETFRKGEDPRPAVRVAVASFERARALDPTYLRVWNSIGRAYGLSVEYEIRRGLSPAASLEAGARAYARAEQDLPDVAMVPNNAGLLWTLEAFDRHLRGEDAEAALARAEAAFGRSLALSPRYAFALKNRGTVNRLRAERALRSGQDPTDLAARAARDYEAAVAINARYTGAFRGLAEVRLLEASYRASRGEPITGPVAKGRAALDQALALDANDGDTLLLGGRYSLLEATLAARRGSPPESALAAAEAALTAARPTSAATAEILSLLAEVHLRRARWLATRPGAAAQAVLEAADRGASAAREALRVHPRYAPPHVVLASLAELRARVEPDRAAALEQERAAALARARELDLLADWTIRDLAD